VKFPFSKTLRQRKDEKLKPPEKTGAPKPQMTFEARLRQFHDAGGDEVEIRVHRDKGIAGAPRGYLTEQWTVGEVYDHGNFHGLVAEAAGGGDFHAEFLVDREPVTTEGGKLEKYPFSISGEPKVKKKKESDTEKEKAPTIDINAIIQSIFKPEVMTALAGFWNTITGQTDKRPDPAAMMQQITQTLVQLKQLTPEPDSVNPIAMIESLLGVIQKMGDQMKPPPTTTGAGGFWDGIGRALAPALTNAMGGPPQLTQGAASPGFAGTGTAGAQTARREEPTPDRESINPLQVLRSMVANRANPDEVAAYAVEAIDTYAKFSTGDIPYQYRGLLDNPGIAIDFLLGFVPNVDPVYAEQVKTAAISYVEAWKAQNQPTEEEANAEDFATPDTEPEPDQDTGDGEPGPDEAHAGEDEEGQ